MLNSGVKATLEPPNLG